MRTTGCLVLVVLATVTCTPQGELGGQEQDPYSREASYGKRSASWGGSSGGYRGGTSGGFGGGSSAGHGGGSSLSFSSGS